MTGIKEFNLKTCRENSKKFVRYKEGANMYSVGISKFQEIAKEAKAIYKINQMVLVNTEIVEAVEEKVLLNIPALMGIYLLQMQNVEAGSPIPILPLESTSGTASLAISMELDENELLDIDSCWQYLGRRVHSGK